MNLHSTIRETLDNSVMEETGRSVGDLASARVATAIMEAIKAAGYSVYRDTRIDPPGYPD
jgi:hypothetical protein